MSRVAKNPVIIPTGVNVTVTGQHIQIKGPKGTLEREIHPDVTVNKEDALIKVIFKRKLSSNLAGTTRALVNNMVKGVTQGFERKLSLVGVGYRAQLKGHSLSLTLGFSHPVDYAVPAGITIETPSQTEIVIKGADKQKVGQVAAEIRSFRPPEVYKGKGVRYSDEVIILKETKKK